VACCDCVGEPVRAEGAIGAPGVGWYEGGTLIYAARTHNGFTPTPYQDLMKRFRSLKSRPLSICELAQGEVRVLDVACREEDVRLPLAEPVLVGQFGPWRIISGTRGSSSQRRKPSEGCSKSLAGTEPRSASGRSLHLNARSDGPGPDRSTLRDKGGFIR
jgi:hypothetical protein